MTYHIMIADIPKLKSTVRVIESTIQQQSIINLTLFIRGYFCHHSGQNYFFVLQLTE